MQANLNPNPTPIPCPEVTSGRSKNRSPLASVQSSSALLVPSAICDPLSAAQVRKCARSPIPWGAYDHRYDWNISSKLLVAPCEFRFISSIICLMICTCQTAKDRERCSRVTDRIYGITPHLLCFLAVLRPKCYLHFGVLHRFRKLQPAYGVSSMGCLRLGQARRHEGLAVYGYKIYHIYIYIYIHTYIHTLTYL